VLHKYDEEMPDINPGLDVAERKVLLAQTAYDLQEIGLGNKFVASVDDYVTDQLEYNYYLMKNSSGDFSSRDVQYGLSFINGMVDMTAENHQAALNSKLKAQLKDYESKFSPILHQPQQQ
jgi:hypothetical protein